MSFLTAMKVILYDRHNFLFLELSCLRYNQMTRKDLGIVPAKALLHTRASSTYKQIKDHKTTAGILLTEGLVDLFCMSVISQLK